MLPQMWAGAALTGGGILGSMFGGGSEESEIKYPPGTLWALKQEKRDIRNALRGIPREMDIRQMMAGINQATAQSAIERERTMRTMGGMPGRGGAIGPEVAYLLRQSGEATQRSIADIPLEVMAGAKEDALKRLQHFADRGVGGAYQQPQQPAPQWPGALGQLGGSLIGQGLWQQQLVGPPPRGDWTSYGAGAYGRTNPMPGLEGLYGSPGGGMAAGGTDILALLQEDPELMAMLLGGGY